MFSTDILRDIIEEWDGFIAEERFIPRDLLPELEGTLDMEEVTVVQGVRRAGKTFLLFGMKQTHGGLYLNLEDDRLMGLSVADMDVLVDVLEEREESILYLDEVQVLDGWERFVRRIHRRFKVFITGSNSALLTSEYATALVGRTISFTARPLDYREFLRFRNERASRASLGRFMNMGGFPRVVLTDRTDLIPEMVDTIIYRDIIPRMNPRHPDGLRSIAHFLLSHIGREFSYRSLREISNIAHESTIREYVAALRSAFLLDIITRYSPSLRKQAGYSKKVYAVDPGFALLGSRMDRDAGAILENIVYHHLGKVGDVSYSKNGYETDFVVCEGTRPVLAVSVTHSIPKRSTYDRERKAVLRSGEDLGVPSILVTYENVTMEDVEVRLAHRFLLEDPGTLIS